MIGKENSNNTESGLLKIIWKIWINEQNGDSDEADNEN